MGGKSKIEWTEQTWNPIVGCSVISPGCTNCYAMQMAARIEAMGNQPRYSGTTRKVKGKAVWTGHMAQAPENTLFEPLRRKKPTTYFVNSMSDLFHESVPDEWIDRVFAVMALSPQHRFQVLTKRSARMRKWFAPFDSRRADSLGAKVLELGYADPLELLPWPLPNVWLGVSTEDQRRADERIPDLVETPAAVRFISAEPLLGPLNLFDFIGPWGPTRASLQAPPMLDWVIVGGESGPGARPMHPDWARSLRDQCAAAGVPFFFKQWGAFADVTDHEIGSALHQRSLQDEIFTADGRVLGVGYRDGRESNGMVEEGWRERGGAWMARVGKAAAGRLLDGVEHNGMPINA